MRFGTGGGVFGCGRGSQSDVQWRRFRRVTMGIVYEGWRESRAGRHSDWVVRLGVALAGAVLLLVVLWLPGRALPHAAAAPAALESVISGTVAWKDSEAPVSGVQVGLKDATQGTVVGQT